MCKITPEEITIDCVTVRNLQCCQNITSEQMFLPRMKGVFPPMHKEYIQEIVKLLESCDDIPLLDLVFQILQKSQQA